MSPSDYYSITRKYAEEVARDGITIEAVYFFGSRAKGGETKDSDLDVCVVSDDFSGDKVEDTKRLYKLTKNVSLMIEPHPMRLDEFGDKYNFLAQEIKRTGVRII